MKKIMETVMDDGQVHPLAKTLPFLSANCDEIVSWTI